MADLPWNPKRGYHLAERRLAYAEIHMPKDQVNLDTYPCLHSGNLQRPYRRSRQSPLHPKLEPNYPLHHDYLARLVCLLWDSMARVPFSRK